MVLPHSGWHMHCYASLCLTFGIQCHIMRNLWCPSLFLVCLAYYWILQWYLCIIPLFVKMVLRQLLVIFWMNSHPNTAPFMQHICLILELTLGQSSVLVWLCQTYLMLVCVRGRPVFCSENISEFFQLRPWTPSAFFGLRPPLSSGDTSEYFSFRAPSNSPQHYCMLPPLRPLIWHCK